MGDTGYFMNIDASFPMFPLSSPSFRYETRREPAETRPGKITFEIAVLVVQSVASRGRKFIQTSVIFRGSIVMFIVKIIIFHDQIIILH